MAKSGGRKVGTGTVRKGPISTPFSDCVSPVPSQAGGWGGERNGCSFPGSVKGTNGTIDEVTTVDVHGAPAVGSKGKASPAIPNRSKY